MTAVHDFFLHNWNTDAKLELSYNTDISESHTKRTEERRALLDRPRRVLKIRWTAISKHETNRFFMHLMRAGVQEILVPLVMDQSVTTATSTGTTINCDTTNRHYTVGGQVVIYELVAGRPSNPQYRTVSAVASGAITVSAALTGSYAAGALVFPLMLSEIVLENELELVTDAYSDISLTFFEVFETAIVPTRTLGSFTTQTSSANTEADNATPILNVPVDFGSKVLARQKRAGARFPLGRDFGLDLLGLRPSLEYSFRYTFLSKADAWQFQSFFNYCRGRQKPWWFVNPASLYEPVGTGSGYVDVEAEGSITNIQDFLEYVAIVMKDGTIYVRKVTGVTLVSGNWRIAASLPGLTLADITKITSAHFVHFSTDTLEMVYRTDETAQVQVACVEALEEKVTTKIGEEPCAIIRESCEGDWSICLIAYLDNPHLIGGDCPGCLFGLTLLETTIPSGDPALCDIAAFVSLADGWWHTSFYEGGVGGCAGQTGGPIPIELTNTHGEFVPVYYGNANFLGKFFTVYASMKPGIGAPGTHAPCAISESGPGRPTWEDTRSGCTSGLEIGSTWFMT